MMTAGVVSNGETVVPESSPAESTWTVSFCLEPADIKAMMNRGIPVGRDRRFAIYTALIFSAAGAGLGMLIAVDMGQSRIPFVAVGAALGLTFIGLMLRRTVPRAIEQARQAGLFVAQTLEIDEEGFRQSYDDGRKNRLSLEPRPEGRVHGDRIRHLPDRKYRRGRATPCVPIEGLRGSLRDDGTPLALEGSASRGLDAATLRGVGPRQLCESMMVGLARGSTPPYTVENANFRGILKLAILRFLNQTPRPARDETHERPIEPAHPA
jgi:hypothetical protein